MTILGAHVAPDRAVVWADTEVFDMCGSPAGWSNKLTVNGAAGAVAIAGGWRSLWQEVAPVFSKAADFDHMQDALPERLRQRTTRLIRTHGMDPREAGMQTVRIFGWSAEAGRIIGVRFDGFAWFEPVLCGTFALPPVPEDVALAPHPAGVVQAAKAQLVRLRELHPDATGGVLTVAEVTPGAVVTRALYDMAADAWIAPDAVVSLIPCAPHPATVE